MIGQTVSYLDLIPGARAGVSYLMGQVAQFQRLPSRFTQAEVAAVAVKRAAEARGNLGVATQMALILQGIASLRTSQGRTQVKLADVLEGLRTAGLGITPVELGVLATTTAAEMASQFKGVAALESSVYSAASKVMSAAEVAALKLAAPSGGSDALTTLGNYGKYAALIAVGYAVILLAKKKRRGPRR